ncbi:type IV secretory system conjugative DNA transfer family protein [Peribacillus frigoritolerans]|nr:type IV secretory system conjugative DNA transfer family protein [Peribacillus frigoritolerans]
MFQELYKVGAQNRAKLPQPVIFILDEFPNLGKFPDYEKFLSTCRGYGIGVLTIVQSITQLQEKYGREQAESILGNCGTKICLGNVNETTAKYFSGLMGKTTAKNGNWFNFKIKRTIIQFRLLPQAFLIQHAT